MSRLRLPHDLPSHVHEALHAIYAGSTADEQESEILEFKEDPAHNPHYAQNPHTPDHTHNQHNHQTPEPEKARAQLVERLIDEVVCLANGEAGGGDVVVGVSDKKSGPEAFTGTSWDPQDLEVKIFRDTRPQLRVNAREITVDGQQLIIIHIPEALTLYTRTRGQASKRVGTSCVPLSEEERSAIRAARANPDYSNRVSTTSLEELPLDYLNEARRLLTTVRECNNRVGEISPTTTGLLAELGLLHRSGSDGETLTRAADILFRPHSPSDVTVRHLWRALPGSAPRVTEITDPVITALPRIRRLIAENADSEVERIQFPNGQEIAIPRFPHQAIDEIITNAFIHRDWRLPNPIVVDQTPQTLKVWSPGPLPIGVDPQHLLTTQSVPRNNRLMSAMRTLGLAEESSRGFDRMWAAMISTGRRPPEVHATDTFVEVTLAAGNPDVSFISFLHRFQKVVPPEILKNVNTLIVLWNLRNAPLITKKQVIAETQGSEGEAQELMNGLESYNVVQRIGNAQEWTLSDVAQGFRAPEQQAPEQHAQAHFDRTSAGAPRSQAPVLSVNDWITVQLEAGKKLRSADVVEATGITRQEATEHLRRLRERGRARIDPGGPQRGPGTLWIKA